MKNLLRYYPSLTQAVGKPVFVWREDEYLPGLGGGSKVRMFEEFNWEGVETVYTTGIVQSNQVRQLTAFCKERYPSVRVVAAVCPDGDEDVDYHFEFTRGSLCYADKNGAWIQYYQPSERDLFNEVVADFRRKSAESEGKKLFIPRGVGCREGTEAWRKVGHKIASAMSSPPVMHIAPQRTIMIVVVSGSGSTHMGLHLGTEKSVRHAFNVIGLSTKRSSEEQYAMLFKRVAEEYPNHELARPLLVDDRFATPDGQYTEDSRRATDTWRPFVDFDTCPIYNDRLFQWLSDTNIQNPIVLINTGNNSFTDV